MRKDRFEKITNPFGSSSFLILLLRQISSFSLLRCCCFVSQSPFECEKCVREKQKRMKNEKEHYEKKNWDRHIYLFQNRDLTGREKLGLRNLKFEIQNKVYCPSKFG
jgi:hypothetical protein